MDEKSAAGVVLVLASFLAIGLLGVVRACDRLVDSELLGDGVHDGRATWSESHEASITVDGDEYSVDYTVLLRYDTNWETGQKSTTELEVRIDDTSHDTVSLSLSGHVEFELATDGVVAWMWITPYLEKGESWNGSYALGYTATSGGIRPGETTNGTIWLVLVGAIRFTDTGKIHFGVTGQRLKASPGLVLRSPPEMIGLKVRVIGERGQSLPFATVTVGEVTMSADVQGVAVVPQLAAGDYEVSAHYKGFASTTTVTEAEMRAGETVVVKLPAYAEIFGVTLTHWMFISLIAVVLLLLGVIVALIFLYRKKERKEDTLSKATTPPT